MTSNDVSTKTDAAPKAESVDMRLEAVVFALAWLEKAFAPGDQLLLRIKVNPMWDPLRAEPRFRALLSRMNLE